MHRAKLIIVDDVFVVKGRGVIVCGKRCDPDSQFRIGDHVEIHRPNTTITPSKIVGIELFGNIDTHIAITLNGINSKADITLGDEIWLLKTDN